MVLQPIKWWIIIVAMSCMAWIIVYSFRKLDRNRNVLTILRAIVYILFLFVLLQPSKIIYEKSKDKPAIAFLADTSASMKISDPALRFKYVTEIFGKEKTSLFNKILDRLKGEYNPIVFTFSDNCQRTGVETLLKANPEGNSTDIGMALADVEKELKGQLLSGIVLISDGANNGNLSPVEIAGRLKAPVYTIGVGDPGKYTDLQITSLKTSDFAFKNTPINIDVEISAYGFSGKTVPVLLKSEDTIIQTKQVQIGSPAESKKVTFIFTPKRVGTFKYTLLIPPYANEVSLKNNAKSFTLQVVRDKIRVMYICGQPSWEYSFLRNILKNDPTLDFISFNILRNAENISLVPENQLSLIPFPTTEIFTTDIFNFDLLVFENFCYSRFNISYQHLLNIKKFVAEYGGAFLMLGGDNSFGKGGYKGTPVEDILPVEMSGPGEEKISIGTFRLRVNQLNHPIVQLSNDPKENKNIWDAMPELDSCNELSKPKPGAVVLGVHPFARNAYGNIPVLSVWDYGKGRVMSMASNTTWRWSFQLAAEGKGNYYYNRFWSQAIRWLIKAEDMKLVHLSSEKRAYIKGEEIKLNIKVFDKYYRENNNAKVRIAVVNPSGKKIELGLASQIPNAGGQYESEYEGEMEGTYKFTAVAYKDTENLGKDELACEVAVPSIELDNMGLNEPLLKAISAASGGKYFHVSKINSEEIVFSGASNGSLVVGRRVSVWNNVFVYLFLIFFLTAEWYIRRKSGML